MADYHEASLARYQKELEQQYKEEYEREKNPNFYWFVSTSKWEDYAYSVEGKNDLIKSAKDAGLRYSCTRHKEGEQY